MSWTTSIGRGAAKSLRHAGKHVPLPKPRPCESVELDDEKSTLVDACEVYDWGYDAGLHEGILAGGGITLTIAIIAMVLFKWYRSWRIGNAQGVYRHKSPGVHRKYKVAALVLGSFLLLGAIVNAMVSRLPIMEFLEHVYVQKGVNSATTSRGVNKVVFRDCDGARLTFYPQSNPPSASELRDIVDYLEDNSNCSADKLAVQIAEFLKPYGYSEEYYFGNFASLEQASVIEQYIDSIFPGVFWKPNR